MSFRNVYEDRLRAESYARLEYPGTYYLAFRDIPALITEHVRGSKALDFGCGAGRSTRFLQSLGFDTTGVDISADMLKLAQESDPQGRYFLIEGDDFSQIPVRNFNVILCAFTFDNIPTEAKKVTLFSELKKLLAADGRIINLVSSPDIYLHEWASFTTKDFPENHLAQSGDKVRIIMTDVEDRRPVEDIVWSDEAYREVYRQAGLEIVQKLSPLGSPDEPYEWVNETEIAPWTIYVLG